MSSPPRYAGAVSRLLAYVVDLVSLSVLFSAGAAAVAFLVPVVTGRRLELSGDRDLAGVGLAVWTFAYFFVSWATVGATLGMSLLGVRVVRPDGTSIGLRRSAVRTFAFFASIALFGLGFLGIIFQAERRALHDLVAGTVVVHATSSEPGVASQPLPT
ncbi:MAG: RDD family protein [Acidimicrobiales bacterium]